MKINFTTHPIEYVNGVRIGSKFKCKQSSLDTIYTRKQDNWYYDEDHHLGYDPKQIDDAYLAGSYIKIE